MKILVIEDDDELCEEIVAYLRRMHHDVESCGTVAAARQTLDRMLADNTPPAAVLCDAGLPDGHGIAIYLAFAPRMPAGRWLLMSGGHDFEQPNWAGGPVPLAPPIIVNKPVSLRHLGQLLSTGAPPPETSS
jgi:DNA-binding NarL/FixJ family response regulator